ALAMVDGHHVANNIGALALGVFVAAMTIGRVAGVKVVDAVGRVPVLRVSAALAVAGLAVMIYIPSVWLAMAGVTLWGLGAALGFPVGLVGGGRRAPAGRGPGQCRVDHGVHRLPRRPARARPAR